MLRCHTIAEASVTWQLNTPSSAAVTLKIIRVTCPVTQVTLTLEVKAWVTATDDVNGTIVATLEPPSCKDIEAGTRVRLNVQFSGLLIDPV